MNEKYNRLKELVAARTNQKCRVIAVTSGKGGVGKTNVAVNLAIALSKNNHRVALVDADTNLANVDLLLGIRPQRTLADVILNGTNLEEVMIKLPSGVSVVPGNSGTKEFLYMDDNIKERLLQEIWSLQRKFDFIVVDTAAGLSPMVVDIVLGADEVLVVTHSEPTAITDAYAMIKILSSFRNDINIKLLLNFVGSKAEVDDVYERLSLVLDHFLGIKVGLAGYIENDEKVRQAVNKQQPFLDMFPGSVASKCINRIAESIINDA